MKIFRDIYCDHESFSIYCVTRLLDLEVLIIKKIINKVVSDFRHV